jgi:hypothetical protein
MFELYPEPYRVNPYLLKKKRMWGVDSLPTTPHAPIY